MQSYQHHSLKTNVVTESETNLQTRTQEAYRPRRIKYYSVGYPPIRVPPWPGLTGGVPEVGYPPLGYPPVQVQLGGYLRWGTPPSEYPPRSDQGVYLRWGTPHWGTPLAGPGLGTPPLRCGLTNKVKLLPPVWYYVRGR